MKIMNYYLVHIMCFFDKQIEIIYKNTIQYVKGHILNHIKNEQH